MDFRMASFDRLVDACLLAKVKSVRTDRRASVATIVAVAATAAEQSQSGKMQPWKPRPLTMLKLLDGTYDTSPLVIASRWVTHIRLSWVV